MEIKKIRLTDLELNRGQVEGLPSNPRQWGKGELANLVKSIRETPELLEARGLIVWPYAGKYVILGGNMRFSALREMNAVDAPCMVMPEDTPIEKLREIVIKDNGAFGSWDYDMLANEWDDLPLPEWGVPAWDTENLESVSAPKEVEEDDFDETKDHIEVRCKKGDVWQLGGHRLMCGDSVSLDDVKKLMGGAEADLWLTDPPYNVGYGMEGSVMMSKRKHRTDGLVVLNDKQEDGAFLEFLKGAYSAACDVMKKGASFYIWHADNEGYNFRKAVRETDGFKLSECLIWVKDTLCLGRNDYHWRHEPCLYGWKEGAGHNWYSDRKQTTCIEMDRPKKSEEHPTMKPLALFAYQMQNSTKAGDIVLDSFGGSGTTLIVAEQIGRKARVMELDPHYCDVIIARWEKATGREAVLCQE